MAKVSLNPTALANPSVFNFPKMAYDLRCIEAKLKNSKKDQIPMIEFQWEVCGPQFVKWKGQDVDYHLGIKIKSWLMLPQSMIEQMSAEGNTGGDLWNKLNNMVEGSTKDLLAIHQSMDLSTDIDTDNIDVSQYIGKCLSACMYGKLEADVDAMGQPLHNVDGTPRVTCVPTFVRNPFCGPAKNQ